MTDGFEFDDGGRIEAGFKGSAGDCVVRALAIVSGLPYMDIYDRASDGCRTQRLTKRSRVKASARNGVNTKRKWFRDYMAELGFAWTPTMHIGSGCKVHLCAEELPSGSLVVAVSKHYTTMIDGVIHDTHDPRRETVWIMPMPDRSLRPNEYFIGDDTMKRVSERCVYGYWQLT